MRVDQAFMKGLLRVDQGLTQGRLWFLNKGLMDI
jgi:hypothetical protein